MYFRYPVIKREGTYLYKIRFHSKRLHTITKRNYNINMVSTIAGSMNDNINMVSTIAESMNDNINMDSTIVGSMNDNINGTLHDNEGHTPVLSQLMLQ
jgi:hypothetical protein